MVQLVMHIMSVPLLKVKVVHVQCKRLDDAGIEAKDVQYLNAHGTSTPVGDMYEIRAMQEYKYTCR